MTAGEGTNAADSWLIDVSADATSRQYIRDLWRLREFLTEVPRSELRARNMNTVLGNLWYLLSPILQVGVYFLVFGKLLDVSRGLNNFLGFLTLGVFLFRFSQQATMAGARSLTSNESLIRSIRFPRAALPISAVSAEVIALVPALVVALMMALLSGETITWTWLLLIPYTALLVMFTMGVSFVAARLNETFRDIQQILPIMFRLLFYLSGILYSVERFSEPDALGKLPPEWVLSLADYFPLNPWYSLTTLAKSAVLAEVSAPPEIWISAIAWAFGALVFGFIFFKRGERRYGRV
ncbi:ABC transporter permease [Actinomycetota bacterium]